MFAWIAAHLRQINRYLDDYYAMSPGCCASGGLSVAQLEGKRPRPELKPEKAPKVKQPVAEV